jgi:hypothetical protein
MNAVRGGTCRGEWIALAAAAVVTGCGIVVALGIARPWRRGRFSEDRELFRGGLMVNGDGRWHFPSNFLRATRCPTGTVLAAPPTAR